MVCCHLRLLLLLLFTPSVLSLFHVFDPAVEVYRAPVDGEVFGIMVKPDELIKDDKSVMLLFDGQNMHSLTMAIQKMKRMKQKSSPHRLKEWVREAKVTVMQAEVFIGDVQVKLGDRVKAGDPLFYYVIRYYEV